MNELTIVTYHYVRPIKNSKFPRIKGLEINNFIRQLDYLQENFSIVTTEEVIKAVKHNSKLPDNACWLTFDDGYMDHYVYVMPELIKRKISGAFFPTKVGAQNFKLLNVNSIQHVLACSDNVDKLVSNLNMLCLSYGISYEKIEEFFLKYGSESKFDNPSTVYIKKMLQYVLPENLRNKITSSLFNDYVGISEREFAKELYMNNKEIAELIKNGMFVGSHGSMHYHLDQISDNEQKKDLMQSLEFLEEVGAQTSDWIICYPHGAYNDRTISIVKELGAVIGLTTDFRTAFIKKDNPLTLPRLDTNNLPQ